MAILRPSVGHLRSLGNFTQPFRWNVSFSKWPRGLEQDRESKRPMYTNDDINFRAESFSLPVKEIAPVEIQIRGNMVRQEGVGTYNSPITLTLVETINMVCFDFLSDWQELAWRTQNQSLGTTRYKDVIEAEMILTLLDNEDCPIYEYTLIGAQISTGEYGTDPDASTADPYKPALGIMYDYFTRRSLNRLTLGAPDSQSPIISQPHS